MGGGRGGVFGPGAGKGKYRVVKRRKVGGSNNRKQSAGYCSKMVGGREVLMID